MSIYTKVLYIDIILQVVYSTLNAIGNLAALSTLTLPSLAACIITIPSPYRHYLLTTKDLYHAITIT
jgi:hypothetical protein